MKKYRVGLEDSGGGRPFYRFIVWEKQRVYVCSTMYVV